MQDPRQPPVCRFDLSGRGVALDLEHGVKVQRGATGAWDELAPLDALRLARCWVRSQRRRPSRLGVRPCDLLGEGAARLSDAVVDRDVLGALGHGAGLRKPVPGAIEVATLAADAHLLSELLHQQANLLHVFLVRRFNDL